MKQSSGIYQIRNVVNGKLYVGSAKYFPARKALHWQRLRAGKHHTNHLQSAWNKYGEASFVFEPLVAVPLPCLLEFEQRVMDYFRDAGQELYNVRKYAHSNLGLKHPPEVGQRISKATTGRKLNPEHIVKMIGRKASPETLEKQRLASTGRPKSEAERAKLSASLTGVAKSPEHVAKVADKRRGCKYTPETIQHYRDVRKGRLFLTPEAIATRSKSYPALIAPDRTMHPAGVRRAEFCRTHGLLESGFNKLCRGEAKVCRGWRLA